MTTTTQPVSISKNLLTVLQAFPPDRAVTIRQLADAAGIEYKLVATRLRSALSKGLVEHVGPAVYRLTDAGRSAEYQPRSYQQRAEMTERMRDRGFATTSELSDKLGVPAATIRDWVRKGKVRHKRIGRNMKKPAVYISVRSVVEFLGEDARQLLQ